MFVCLFPFVWRCCPSGSKDGPPVQSATIHVKSHCPFKIFHKWCVLNRIESYKIVSNRWLYAVYRIVRLVYRYSPYVEMCLSKRKGLFVCWWPSFCWHTVLEKWWERKMLCLPHPSGVTVFFLLPFCFWNSAPCWWHKRRSSSKLVMNSLFCCHY